MMWSLVMYTATFGLNTARLYQVMWLTTVVFCHLLSRMLPCDWIPTVSVCCSPGGLLLFSCLVVVFLDCGHPSLIMRSSLVHIQGQRGDLHIKTSP